AVSEVSRGFEANVSNLESIVGEDLASLLDEKEFFGDFVGREETHALEVEPKAVDRLHPDSRVLARVVLVFDPAEESAVERVDRGEVEVSRQKRLAHSAEEAFDFSFGGTVSHWGVAE